MRCQPKDMRSFILSYESATLVKTSATRCVFSDSVTVSKPKCVVFSPGLLPELVLAFCCCCCWRQRVVLAEKGRDILAGAEERLRRARDRRSGRAAIVQYGPAALAAAVQRRGGLSVLELMCGGLAEGRTAEERFGGRGQPIGRLRGRKWNFEVWRRGALWLGISALCGGWFSSGWDRTSSPGVLVQVVGILRRVGTLMVETNSFLLETTLGEYVALPCLVPEDQYMRSSVTLHKLSSFPPPTYAVGASLAAAAAAASAFSFFLAAMMRASQPILLKPQMKAAKAMVKRTRKTTAIVAA